MKKYISVLLMLSFIVLISGSAYAIHWGGDTGTYAGVTLTGKVSADVLTSYRARGYASSTASKNVPWIYAKVTLHVIDARYYQTAFTNEWHRDYYWFASVAREGGPSLGPIRWCNSHGVHKFKASNGYYYGFTTSSPNDY